MVRYLNNSNPSNNISDDADDGDGGGSGGALLAGGVSAASPQVFTGHNRFSENVQVNAMGSSLDVVVGRYLYTGNDILKEIESDGVVSEVEYTTFKGCAKLNGGSLNQPQNFTGNNSFSAPITVSNARFQVKNNTASILDVNGSNVTITPSGVSGTGLEIRAVGDPADPNANKIYLQENTFMPASADLYLADLGSLRETLNTLVSYAVAPPWQLLTSVTFAGATTNWVTGISLAIDGFNSWQPASVIIHSYIDSNGDPIYRCQLRGQIRSSLNPAVFAGSTNLLTIPAALRPLKSQFHIVRAQVGSDTIGSIQILSTGRVNVIDVDANVEGHLHLENIEWWTN